jgi:nitrogen fixation NifU-like protein
VSLEDDLYREVIIDHYQHPRNKGVLEPADVKAEGANPLCGDEIHITFNLDGDKIKDIRFTGHGCSISQSSASMMTEIIKEKNMEDAEKIANIFKDMMLKNGTLDELEELEEDEELVEDLESLEGVKKYPVRIKCAILAWNTLLEGIEEKK